MKNWVASPPEHHPVNVLLAASAPTGVHVVGLSHEYSLAENQARSARTRRPLAVPSATERGSGRTPRAIPPAMRITHRKSV